MVVLCSPHFRTLARQLWTKCIALGGLERTRHSHPAVDCDLAKLDPLSPKLWAMPAMTCLGTSQRWPEKSMFREIAILLLWIKTYQYIWLWINTYKNTIFSGMNIHFNPAMTWGSLGTRVLTHWNLWSPENLRPAAPWTSATMPAGRPSNGPWGAMGGFLSHGTPMVYFMKNPIYKLKYFGTPMAWKPPNGWFFRSHWGLLV